MYLMYTDASANTALLIRRSGISRDIQLEAADWFSGGREHWTSRTLPVFLDGCESQSELPVILLQFSS